MFIQFNHPEYGMVTAFQCDCSEEAVLSRMASQQEQEPPEEVMREFENRSIWDVPEDKNHEPVKYVDPKRLERVTEAKFRKRLEEMEYVEF